MARQEDNMNKVAKLIWIMALFSPATWVFAGDYQGLLVEANKHLETFKSHEQAQAITNIAGAAKAVVIIPDQVAASLIVGYKRGTGAMFRRHGTQWSDPVFMTFVEYSIGTQLGGSSNAVIVLILTNKVVDGIVEGVNHIGTGGGFALGSLGLGSTGGGSLGGGLEMLSVSTRAGLQVGGAVGNTKIYPADEFNAAAYGDDFDIEKILSTPGGKLAAANMLRESLESATRNSYEK